MLSVWGPLRTPGLGYGAATWLNPEVSLVLIARIMRFHSEKETRDIVEARDSQSAQSEMTRPCSLSKANHVATPNFNGAELFSPTRHPKQGQLERF